MEQKDWKQQITKITDLAKKRLETSKAAFMHDLESASIEHAIEWHGEHYIKASAEAEIMSKIGEIISDNATNKAQRIYNYTVEIEKDILSNSAIIRSTSQFSNILNWYQKEARLALLHPEHGAIKIIQNIINDEA